MKTKFNTSLRLYYFSLVNNTKSSDTMKYLYTWNVHGNFYEDVLSRKFLSHNFDQFSCRLQGLFL